MQDLRVCPGWIRILEHRSDLLHHSPDCEKRDQLQPSEESGGGEPRGGGLQPPSTQLRTPGPALRGLLLGHWKACPAPREMGGTQPPAGTRGPQTAVRHRSADAHGATPRRPRSSQWPQPLGHFCACRGDTRPVRRGGSRPRRAPRSTARRPAAAASAGRGRERRSRPPACAVPGASQSPPGPPAGRGPRHTQVPSRPPAAGPCARQPCPFSPAAWFYPPSPGEASGGPGSPQSAGRAEGPESAP